MKAITDQLHDVDASRVSTYRAVLTGGNDAGFAAPRLTLVRKATLDSVTNELRDLISILNDNESAIYTLVIQDLSTSAEDDDVFVPIDTHRVKISRRQALVMAA